MLGDPFEGSRPMANVSLMDNKIRAEFSNLSPKNLEKFGRDLSLTFQGYRLLVLVNCWNMNQCESTSLWETQGQNNQGIAIQSTFKRLSTCFSSKESYSVYIGKVQYVNYTTDFISRDLLLDFFLYKRMSFAHERELRAIIVNYPKGQVVEELPFSEGGGEYVDVNLDVLVERVYVAPTAQEWFKELVGSVMKKYGLNLKPIKSGLDAQALF